MQQLSGGELWFLGSLITSPYSIEITTSPLQFEMVQFTLKWYICKSDKMPKYFHVFMCCKVRLNFQMRQKRNQNLLYGRTSQPNCIPNVFFNGILFTLRLACSSGEWHQETCGSHRLGRLLTAVPVPALPEEERQETDSASAVGAARLWLPASGRRSDR